MTTIITQEHRTRMQESKRLSLNVSQLIQEARLDAGTAQEVVIARRLESMPETCRRTYLRAMQGRSLAAAIKAFCMECVGWDRTEVARCTSPACPPYPPQPDLMKSKIFAYELRDCADKLDAMLTDIPDEYGVLDAIIGIATTLSPGSLRVGATTAGCMRPGAPR